MISQRWSPLMNLIDARIREFFREPEVIFWVYGFPLILAVTLGWAFSSVKPPAPTIDVLATPGSKRAEEIAAKLMDERYGDEKPKVQVLPEDECEARVKRGETALYILYKDDKIIYRYDPARAESVQARYWIESLLSRHPPQNAVAEDSHLTEPGRRYIDFLLPGLIGTNIMGGGLFGVGFVLVDMRVRKLFKRLMATPMRHSDFLLSLLVSRLIFLLPEMTLLLLVGYFLFGVPIYGSILALAIVILAGATAFAGIGLLLGCRTEKTETASGFINLAMLPQYILSGVFFSSKNFPEEAQWFIQALPLTQLIDGMREVMLEGATLWEVKWRILILLVYSVVTFTLALKLFKWR
jgi:ABC-type multidrug transport system permease subunit